MQNYKHMPPLTLEQAKGLRRGQTLYHRLRVNVDGTPQVWRVNGKVKTQPDGIRVPLAHGMYEHSTLYSHNLCNFSLVNADDIYIDGDRYWVTGIEKTTGKRVRFIESNMSDFVARMDAGHKRDEFTDIQVWRRRDGRRKLLRRYA